MAGQNVKVENVNSAQVGQNIEIYYDVIGSSEEDRFNITLFCSVDGGESYSNRLKKVEGDVGYNQPGGLGKKITWSILDEMSQLISDNVVFKVKLEFIPEEARNLIFVEGGVFYMGTNDEKADADAKPRHKIELDDFFINKYEVTVAEYRKFCEETDSTFPDKPLEWKDDHPMTFVSWYDANAYCKWLSEKTGKTFRLPTEAEWEYASRGGYKFEETKFSGSDNIFDVGWHKQNSAGVMHSPVGGLSANQIGIFDMTGNVWEWCSDFYSQNYYKQSPSKNPKGPRVGYKDLKSGRGGSWFHPAIPVTYRYYMTASASSNYMGFRIVMEP